MTVVVSKDTRSEQQDDVCKPRTICSAGQWTKKVGTYDEDTVCADCAAGKWRAVAPKASEPAEWEEDVCKPHKVCSAGQWVNFGL